MWNLGPLCRRHHRTKQTGWTKHRQPDGSISWTSPTGRNYLSPSQHPAVPDPTPSAAPIEAAQGDLDTDVDTDFDTDIRDADLAPWQRDAEHRLDQPHLMVWVGADADPHWLIERDTDSLSRLITDTDTRWSLDLADPYRWQPAAAQL